MSARDFLFGAGMPSETIEVGGQEVEVRGLTTGGKDRLQQAVVEGAGFRATLLRDTCFVDGEPLFGEDDDIDAIPSARTEPLVDAAIRVNALSEEEVEEIEGN